MHQIAQGYARLHFAAEAHQHGFGHVQRHDAGGGGERHQAGARRERNADGEAGVGVAAGADGVGQQHAIHPRVDDAVAGAQGDTGAIHHEVRQTVLGFDVHRLGIGRGVAEGLHNQIRLEAEAGEVLEFVSSHRAGGVLRTHGGHLRLAVLAGTHTVQTTGAAHHLLRQCITAIALRRRRRLAKHLAFAEAEGLARPRGQAATDDQVDAPTGANLVQQDFGFYLEFTDHFITIVAANHAFIRMHIDHIPHFHPAHIHFDGQGAGIFQRIEEDRRDLPAEAIPPGALVGDAGNILAGVPQHGIDRGFSRGTGADHIAHIDHRKALFLQLRQNFEGIFRQPRTRIFQHRQRVQGNIRARPRIRRRRQIVRIGLAGHLEHRYRDGRRHLVGAW